MKRKKRKKQNDVNHFDKIYIYEYNNIHKLWISQYQHIVHDIDLLKNENTFSHLKLPFTPLKA